MTELDAGPPTRRASPDIARAIAAALDELPPGTIVRAAAGIAKPGGLFYGYVPEVERDRERRDAAIQMALHPELARVHLFHRNGFVREAALASLDGALSSPFMVAAVAYRLNDWVEPVRAAAELCGERVFPATDARILAEAAFALLALRRDWRRWGAGSPALENALFRPDVLSLLVRRINEARTGPVGRVLHAAMPRVEIDRHLPRLAREAFLPNVRALAYRCLIEGSAQWSVGFRREWVDKVYNLSRRVPVMESRQVERFLPVPEMIEAASRDRSAAVRLVAADAAAARRDDLPNLDTIISLLAADRSPPIRERLAFIEKERATSSS